MAPGTFSSMTTKQQHQNSGNQRFQVTDKSEREVTAAGTFSSMTTKQQHQTKGFRQLREEERKLRQQVHSQLKCENKTAATRTQV